MEYFRALNDLKMFIELDHSRVRQSLKKDVRGSIYYIELNKIFYNCLIHFNFVSLIQNKTKRKTKNY